MAEPIPKAAAATVSAAVAVSVAVETMETLIECPPICGAVEVSITGGH